MKTRAVHFEDGYARIFTGPSDDVLALPGVLVNPDMSQVAHTSPEFWKQVDGKLLPMTDAERAEREKDISAEVDPTWTKVVRTDVKIKYVPAWAYLIMAVEAVAVVALLVSKF